MPKVPRKTLRPPPTKEVSVMAWIEDPDRRVLLVHQAGGLELWTLPGGKVKRGESLVKALPTAESPLGALVKFTVCIAPRKIRLCRPKIGQNETNQISRAFIRRLETEWISLSPTFLAGKTEISSRIQALSRESLFPSRELGTRQEQRGGVPRINMGPNFSNS